MKNQEVKLSYKPQIRPEDRIKITSSSEAVEYLRNIWDEDIEHVESFYIILLNRSNTILGYKMLSKGGITGTVADVRVIFQTAILMNASGIILSHNHPSGNLHPSDEDVKLTKKVKDASHLFDIKILDHIILTEYNYYSLLESGVM
jgi:DNA repair protein RadC